MQTEAKRAGGFTLVEVMIVVVVVAILAAVALPGYQSYVVRTWRSKATGCLTSMAQAMEGRYAVGFSYAADPNDPAVLPPNSCSTEDGMAAQYAFSFSGTPGADYTLQAVPQGSQASSDAGCGTLTLTHLGVRGVSGTRPVDDCW